jgi:putative ABC transport system permease protein
MYLLDSLAIGLRALSANRLRSVLTVLGIIIGVAAVVCMISVGSGAREEVSEKIRTLGANLLLIRPGAQLSGAARLESGTGHKLTEDDALALRRDLANVQAVAPLLSRPMQVVVGNNNWATLIAGIDNDYLVAREWQVESGRAFTLDELGSAAKVAIIGADISEALFSGVPPVGATLRIGSVPFAVVGTLTRKGQGAAGRSKDDIAFIPL